MKKKPSPSSPPAEGQIDELLGVYEQLLPSHVVHQLLQETQQVFYSRLLPPILILWGFIFQRLNSDHSGDAAWSYLSSEPVQERFRLNKPHQQALSESTSGYCQARQRLPLSFAQQALKTSSARLADQLGEKGRWHGQRVNLLDGSTLLLSAADELVEHYGVSHNQHGALHWPLMRLVAGFDYFSGAANGVVEGPYALSEHPLAAQLIRDLGAGWVHVGDRYLGAYHLVQVIAYTHSQAVLRLNPRVAKRLAGQALQSGADLDVVWQASRQDQVEPDLPTPAVPGRLIYRRLEKEGFRPIELYVFTTLTDRQAYPAEEILALYAYRWNIELDLRQVKSTLRMESLEGKSVEMVRKELLLGLLAYNLVRGLMAVAAVNAEGLPCQLSLAKCWRRIGDACRGLPSNASPAEVEHVLTVLLARLGRCVLPQRKRERFEPRAVWGRPQVYPKIKGSREAARQAQLQLLKNKS